VTVGRSGPAQRLSRVKKLRHGLGQLVVIESTAEGQEGAFYDMAQKARARALSGQPLTSLDYRFHFVPWWADPGYALHDGSVVIGAEDARYFERLEAQGTSACLLPRRVSGSRFGPGSGGWRKSAGPREVDPDVTAKFHEEVL